MMRIKEAIQRRKLIQQLNDDYTDEQIGKPGGSSTPSLVGPRKSDDWSRADSDASGTHNEITSISLHHFVGEFSSRLTDNHRRALRVTWKRLSEAPKTSGRGTLQIMEKIFEKLLDAEPEIMKVFYRSAFLKCVDDRKRKCASGTIATIRDHAHLMIDFIDAVMSCMFDLPLNKPVWDPATIGRAHSRLLPLGFRRHVWHKLGEIFAESMFSQDCIRAYPHAASAWSMFAVAWTDVMYTHSRPTRTMALTPYTPSSFSSWSDPTPYASTGSGTPIYSSSGYNSNQGGASPSSHRSRARSRASARQKRHHRQGSATPNSRNSSRSASRSRNNSRRRKVTPRH
ncbi:hypothetical protein M3Y98_00130700 [Aphelenchoides besseyi]|nr:hypothetical protein M3Y98_00130700 [Aphelenchoides besseyi]KAI6199608.1 hypothetical protein M3Y96_00645100 [Aphelenchoides besseyi]